MLFEGGVLKAYYAYLEKHPNSLLSRFFGVYHIRIQGMGEISAVLMNNLLGKDFIDVVRMYDLKGSTLGRIVNLKGQTKETGLRVLKDLNFLELKEFIDTHEEKKRSLMAIVEEDAKFLAKMNLMDYSLLFVKCKKTKVPHQFKRMPALIYTNMGG